MMDLWPGECALDDRIYSIEEWLPLQTDRGSDSLEKDLMDSSFVPPPDADSYHAVLKRGAERSIEQALLGLCHATDAYDPLAFLSLCCADAQMDFGARYCGPAEGFFLSIVEARGGTKMTRHKLGKVEIDFSEDFLTAKSLAVVLADVIRKDGAVTRRRFVHGEYRDVWCFRDNSWLLQRRNYCQVSESQI